MKRHQTPGLGGTGTLLQVLLVGVLLFAVVWQVRGSIGTPGERSWSPDSPSRTYVTTDQVNLRSGPGVEHDVLSVVPPFAEVTVTGSGADGFLPVDVNGMSAWMSAEYLVPQVDAGDGSSSDVTGGGVSGQASLPGLLVADVSAAEAPVGTGEPQSSPTETPVPEVPPVAVAAQTYQEPEPGGLVVEGPAERWIEVDRSSATVTLHEGDKVVARYDALIGKDPSADGYYATAVGTFYVHVKERRLAETPFAPGVYLTDFVGFDPDRSNGFHSPTRDKDGKVLQTGGTATLGCVRLGEDEARFLYDFASIGTRVKVHD